MWIPDVVLLMHRVLIDVIALSIGSPFTFSGVRVSFHSIRLDVLMRLLSSSGTVNRVDALIALLESAGILVPTPRLMILILVVDGLRRVLVQHVPVLLAIRI